RLQRPVDRGQPDLRAVLAHLRVDVLGAAEPLTLTQYFVDGSSPGSHVTSSTRILPASLTFDSWYRPRRMNLPTPRESTKPASASRTMAAPGGTLVEAVEASSPPTAATVPNSIASSIVVRNPRVSCWLVATGITMSALTSSSPTTRMAITTVSAAVTATSMLRNRTGSPLALAISSSWQSTNSSLPNTATTPSTSTASPPMIQMSSAVTLAMAPNRYELSLALLPPGAMPMSMTPPAMPP